MKREICSTLCLCSASRTTGSIANQISREKEPPAMAEPSLPGLFVFYGRETDSPPGGVESAFPQLQKIGPSITRYTAVGLILGILLSLTSVVVAALMDDTIHDESYVLRTYDYPILGKVPNLINSGNKSYGYYYQKHRKAAPERKDG